MIINISFSDIICCEFVRTNFVVVLKTNGINNNLQIYEIDHVSYTIKSHRSISISDGACLFGSINGKLVFSNVEWYCPVYDRKMGNWTIIEDGDVLVEMKDTYVSVEMSTVENVLPVFHFIFYKN